MEKNIENKDINEDINDTKYTILYKETADTEIYAHTEFEDLKGFISGKSIQEILNIEKSIKKCTCGGDVELHEFECMGDGSYTIKCKKCDRYISRSSYDCDIKKWDDVLNFCIRDWNNGLTYKDIEKLNKEEFERKVLRDEDLVWKEWNANNIITNPLEGYYSLLFKKDSKGDIICCKWTIELQQKEIEPMFISNDIESYNLFCQMYYDFKGPFKYPEPRKDSCILITDDITLDDNGVNDKGYFVRNYKTLEEAKKGALARCGWKGFNKDTLIKI